MHCKPKTLKIAISVHARFHFLDMGESSETEDSGQATLPVLTGHQEGPGFQASPGRAVRPAQPEPQAFPDPQDSQGPRVLRVQQGPLAALARLLFSVSPENQAAQEPLDLAAHRGLLATLGVLGQPEQRVLRVKLA